MLCMQEVCLNKESSSMGKLSCKGGDVVARAVMHEANRMAMH